MCPTTFAADHQRNMSIDHHSPSRRNAWKLSAVAASIFVYSIDSSAAGKPAAAGAEHTVVAALTLVEPGAGSSARRARVNATLRKARPAVARNVRIAPALEAKSAAPVDLRATAPVVSVTGTGPGQGGYVHYFVVRPPGGGEWEVQVGIEMPDQRIAWSFLDLGVVVSPFIEFGTVEVNRKHYEVEYLYGLRPFPDANTMHTLQRELEARVLPWAEGETPYCLARAPSDPVCVSCLGFVLRILFPGATPAYALLPHDFERDALKTIYNTDDLLLYLTGMNSLGGKEARLKRIEELAMPGYMRDDVMRLVNLMDAAPQSPAATGAPSGKPAPQRVPQPGKS